MVERFLSEVFYIFSEDFGKIPAKLIFFLLVFIQCDKRKRSSLVVFHLIHNAATYTPVVQGISETMVEEGTSHLSVLLNVIKAFILVLVSAYVFDGC